MTTTTTRRPGLISDSAVIAAAMVVMNAANYAFTITAARFLGPTEYGALAAMLGVLMVVNVVSLGLQATAARRVAAQPDARDAIERDVMRATTWCAAGLGLVMLAISPLVSAVLGLDSWLLAGLVDDWRSASRACSSRRPPFSRCAACWWAPSFRSWLLRP